MKQIELKFYNSRTKQIDVFEHDKTIPINMYTCGPTVYDRVHLGNLKTFLWSDFVVQYLNAIGYKTNHIMNITDIDDILCIRLLFFFIDFDFDFEISLDLDLSFYFNYFDLFLLLLTLIL